MALGMLVTIVYSLLGTTVSARPRIEGQCVEKDKGLEWLSTALSDGAVISCRGEPLQQYNAGRYWGTQYSENASVVVFPASTADVSATVEATQMTDLGTDYAFVSGGHAMSNSSSSAGLVIDLSFLNHTKIVEGFKVDDKTYTAIEYGTGATTIQFQTALNGTGWTGIAARVASVGMGGFSTGGGVGYLAGAYGYASDRVIALEIVLPSGEIVLATDGNEYSDLLWAFRGAGLGQFGIVTTFYQEAVPEPTSARVAFYLVADDSLERSFENTVDFFDNHNDPFSLVYYTIGFLPADFTDPNPAPSDFSVRNIVTTVYFEDPTFSGKTQKSPQDTFSALLDGVNQLGSMEYTVPFADMSVLGQVLFPYGMRRGFWGPQTTRITTSFLRSIHNEFNDYINGVLAAGDFPATSTFVMQYMSPGLNGNLPTSDEATAWPHSVAGHQTLFNPGWMRAETDALARKTSANLNALTYAQQATASGHAEAYAADSVCGHENLCDYPNYMGPEVPGRRVWGKNIDRLIAIKEKYDPLCTLHAGKVFASAGCVKRGVANVFGERLALAEESEDRHVDL